MSVRTRCHIMWSSSNILRFLVSAGLFQISSTATASSSCTAHSRRLQTDSSARRLGNAQWYCHEWERDHVEACATVVLLIMAIGFEKIHHHFLHKAQHSFVYGQSMLSEDEKDQAVNRSIFGKPLRLTLFARMGGEFMVLGFLAFTIWCCGQLGIFDEMAHITASDMTLPSQGSDYLHLMEAVHMQLFVAMIIYFALAFKCTISSDACIKDLEVNRGLWIEQIMNKTAENYDTDATTLREFKKWRGHFLETCTKEILSWRTKQPDTFHAIMHAMNIGKKDEDVTVGDIHKVCTGRFSFCTYLVFSVCSAAQEVVNVSEVALLTIIGAKLFLALFHRALQIELLVVSAALTVGCFAFIGCLYAVTMMFKTALEADPGQIQLPKSLQWLPGYLEVSQSNPEVLLLNLLQVLLFFVCHSFAGMMIDQYFWIYIFQDREIKHILVGLWFFTCLIMLAFMVPRVLPDFASVTALPPLFSRSNERIVHLVAVQVVDAKMVAARAQMATHHSEKGEHAPAAPKKEEKDLGLMTEEPKDTTSMPQASFGADSSTSSIGTPKEDNTRTSAGWAPLETETKLRLNSLNAEVFPVGDGNRATKSQALKTVPEKKAGNEKASNNKKPAAKKKATARQGTESPGRGSPVGGVSATPIGKPNSAPS